MGSPTPSQYSDSHQAQPQKAEPPTKRVSDRHRFSLRIIGALHRLIETHAAMRAVIGGWPLSRCRSGGCTQQFRAEPKISVVDMKKLLLNSPDLKIPMEALKGFSIASSPFG
jgi:hypothetical protein